MNYKTILAVLIFGASCTNTNCDLNDFTNGDWKTIDASISYKLCSSNKVLLSPDDSIEIEYLGVLEENKNILVQNPLHQSFFSVLTTIPFGKFQLKQLKADTALAKVLALLTKNSECLIKYKINNFPSLPQNEMVTLYFKPQTAIRNILAFNQKMSTSGYVDSVIYTSHEAAAEKFSKDADSSWKSLLESNPLPSSSDIFIRKGPHGEALKDSLKKLLSDEGIVADIIFSRKDTSAFSQIPELIKFPFFIRIKSQ